MKYVSDTLWVHCAGFGDFDPAFVRGIAEAVADAKAHIGESDRLKGGGLDLLRKTDIPLDGRGRRFDTLFPPSRRQRSGVRRFRARARTFAADTCRVMTDSENQKTCGNSRRKSARRESPWRRPDAAIARKPANTLST